MYPQRKPGSTYPQIKKLSWWHESIIDWMLLNPQGRLADAAVHFTVTQAWLSIIVNSDLFRARLTIRRAEMANEVGSTVIEKLSGIAGQALESIAEKIEKEKTKIPLGELRETATMALEALGYGAKSAGPQNANVYNFNGPTHVSRDVLESARQRMRLVGARAADEPVLDRPVAQPALIDARAEFSDSDEHDASVQRVHNDDSNPLRAPGPLPPGRQGDMG